MKRIAVLFVLVCLSVSAHATVFRTTLQPSAPSTAGGGAFLTVNLLTRGWSLSGEISNLVFSASSAGILGPTQPGRAAPPWIPLGHNVEPEGPLTGAGVFTAEELEWLQKGLLSVRVWTDQGRFPEGELNGPLSLVPEPGAIGFVTALGLGTFAAYRRRTLNATSSSKAGLLTEVSSEEARTSSRRSTTPVRGFSHSIT